MLANQVISHDAGIVKAFDINRGEELWHFRCRTTATSTPVLSGDRLCVSTWYHLGDSENLERYPPFAKMLAEHDKNENGVIDKGEFPNDFFLFNRPEGKDAQMTGMPLRISRLDRDRDGSVNQDEWERFRKQSDERRNSIQKHGLISIPTDQSGSIGLDDVQILESKAIPEVPSPIVYKNRAFLMKNGGILTCVDLKSGELADRKRFGPPGTHYASPIIHDGILIQASGKGHVTLIDIRGGKPIKIASNDLGEPIHATPAIANNTIYIRTASKLLAFSSGN